MYRPCDENSAPGSSGCCFLFFFCSRDKCHRKWESFSPFHRFLPSLKDFLGFWVRWEKQLENRMGEKKRVAEVGLSFRNFCRHDKSSAPFGGNTDGDGTMRFEGKVQFFPAGNELHWGRPRAAGPPPSLTVLWPCPHPCGGCVQQQARGVWWLGLREGFMGMARSRGAWAGASCQAPSSPCRPYTLVPPRPT